MKRALFFVAFTSVISQMAAFCQSTFQETYASGSGFIWSCAPAYDGEFVFVGSTTASGAGNADVCLMKMDNNGSLLWAKTYGDTGVDYGNSVVQTLDSGFIIAGYTQRFGIAHNHVYVIKTDVDGNLVWSKTYDANDDCSAKCISLTNDGGYIITGSSMVWGSMREEVYLLKIDSAGNVLWSKSIGDSYEDFGTYVQQTQDGGYIVAGCYMGTAVFLVRTDSLGDTLWTKTYGGPLQCPYSIIEAPDHGYFVAGISAYNTTDVNGFILRTDSLGNISWVKLYGTIGFDYFYMVSPAFGNGIIAAGFTNYTGQGAGDAYLVRVNSAGDTLWTKSFGDSLHQEGLCAIESTDHGYVMGGLYGNDLFYILKTDSSGNSFCNTNNPGTIISNPQIQVYNFGTNAIPVNTNANQCVNAVGNGGSMNTICSSLALNEVESHSLMVYPNPSHNSFFLQLEKLNRESKIEIADIFGKIIHEENTSSQSKPEVEVHIENIQPGIYIVKVTALNKQWISKLIIQ